MHNTICRISNLTAASSALFLSQQQKCHKASGVITLPRICVRVGPRYIYLGLALH